MPPTPTSAPREILFFAYCLLPALMFRVIALRSRREVLVPDIAHFGVDADRRSVVSIDRHPLQIDEEPPEFRIRRFLLARGPRQDVFKRLLMLSHEERGESCPPGSLGAIRSDGDHQIGEGWNTGGRRARRVIVSRNDQFHQAFDQYPLLRSEEPELVACQFRTRTGRRALIRGIKTFEWQGGQHFQNIAAFHQSSLLFLRSLM